MAQNLTPTDRPALQRDALIALLNQYDVTWVLCGSCVLAIHAPDLEPNDLDVVPDLAPDNLRRLADLLTELEALPAYFDGWDHPRNTLRACHAWRPEPASPEVLDWLYVTRLGMLDIVIENAAPFSVLMQNATLEKTADGIPFHACDPVAVLDALAPRNRRKDAARQATYATLRARFGLPPLG